MLNLHNTIYSQTIDESKIKGSFTKEQRNNILTIEDEHKDPYIFEYVCCISRVLLMVYLIN
jgi:hypothetical protein